MERPGLRVMSALAGATLMLVTGCSSGNDQEKVQTIERATPAQSPPTATPAGIVDPLPLSVESTTFDPDTRTLIVTGDGGRRVVLLDADDPASPARDVPVEGTVRQVTPAGDATALLATSEGLGVLDLRGAAVTDKPVQGDLRAAAELPDGRIVTGDESGEIRITDTQTQESKSITGLVSTDAFAVVGNTLTALDRKQTSVTDVDIDEEHLGMALRVGEGASALTTDSFGRILITDTPGDELLVYTTDSLVLRQRFPVGPAPVGVTYEEGANVAWVTLTGTNEVVGFDLSSGVGVETARFPTVRQPNSVAVDSDTGDLYVGSGSGDGLQRIPTRTVP